MPFLSFLFLPPLFSTVFDDEEQISNGDRMDNEVQIGNGDRIDDKEQIGPISVDIILPKEFRTNSFSEALYRRGADRREPDKSEEF
jgi:hypothetical protein